MRNYKCLGKSVFTSGKYSLIPIRNEDQFQIRTWRNDQIGVLRQKRSLTEHEQEQYFLNVVSELFLQDTPGQMLFSFLEDGRLIGYGGLVHIDWDSKNAEISFLTETGRSKDIPVFINDWKVYLALLKSLVRSELGFHKIYTYAFDIRPHLYEALRASFFREEARLREHIRVNSELRDVVIHSYFFHDIAFRQAEETDVMLYFNWANDDLVRKNSFVQDTIALEDHKAWFADKLTSEKSLLLVAIREKQPVGQIRFEEKGGGNFEISFSVDNLHRGRGLGQEIIRKGTEMLFELKPASRRVIAKVKPDNIVSARSFEKIGFTKRDMENSDTAYTYCFER